MMGFLAACGAPPPPPLQTEATAPPEAPAEPEEQETVARVPEIRERSPSDLIDLSAREVSERLGTADFSRTDPPAELRQYRNEACILDAFLYTENGTLVVRHVETRSRKGHELSPSACYTQLLRRQAQRSS